MQVMRLAQSITHRGMAQADERTKLESDMVTGIEAVKTQAWEKFFYERITGIRSKELAIMWQTFNLLAINTLMLQVRVSCTSTGTQPCACLSVC
jgi:ABC-type bacteriocin/lantibiotic exporter with double-glycine peptidase domain